MFETFIAKLIICYVIPCLFILLLNLFFKSKSLKVMAFIPGINLMVAAIMLVITPLGLLGVLSYNG